MDEEETKSDKDVQGMAVTDGKGGSSCVVGGIGELVSASLLSDGGLAAVEAGAWLVDRAGQYGRSRQRRSSHSWDSWTGSVGGRVVGGGVRFEQRGKEVSRNGLGWKVFQREVMAHWKLRLWSGGGWGVGVVEEVVTRDKLRKRDGGEQDKREGTRKAVGLMDKETRRHADGAAQ